MDDTQDNATSVPKPNNIIGLGAMFGLFGFGWLRQRRCIGKKG